MGIWCGVEYDGVKETKNGRRKTNGKSGKSGCEGKRRSGVEERDENNEQVIKKEGV